MPVSTIHKILCYILSAIHTQKTHVLELLPADLPVWHTFALVFLTRMEATVWCGLTASFIVRPLFFEVGPACPVKGKRFQRLLHNQVIPPLQQGACVDRIIVMKDGASLLIAKPAREAFRK
ncbi:transposable element tc3 transposase [Caerostris extrusa]|uniref:Transposable element tc3 transposase n=1 Tax=Caerostris extrusa TaxID=172846 RepID=A0AAV4X5I0_CAEEX|nr:transposable element tc3 transposase [Caerostris extrusa]